MVVAQAINISELEPITSEMPRPLNYRDRTLHKLPSDTGPLQNKLKEIDLFCDIQQMIINQSKTKTAVFNTKTKDFYPRMEDSNGHMYENVEEFKLLGVEFVSHPISGVKWDKYVTKCIRKAYSNMWILKRLKEFGVSTEDLLLTYQSRIRIHLELNVPLWHFSITKKLSRNIENVQKSCLFLILGQVATTEYYCNLALLNLDLLSERRVKLCTQFAKKTFKHPQHGKMFTKNDNRTTYLGGKRNVIVPTAKTARYDRSSIPSLARILNTLD